MTEVKKIDRFVLQDIIFQGLDKPNVMFDLEGYKISQGINQIAVTAWDSGRRFMINILEL